MSRLDNMGLTTLDREMQLVANSYFTSKKKKEKEQFLYDVDANVEINDCNLYIKKVESAFNKLEPIEQLFINNDYFFEDYPNWWMQNFSEKTYLKCKKKAIIHFLRLFFDEE